MIQQEKIYIGLVNPKSPENVASVMRAAGNFYVDSVFYTGIRYPRAARLNPSTVDMSRKLSKGVALNSIEDIIDDAPDNVKFVCVEFAEGATALPDYQHPHNAIYIFGPEDGSINQDIVDRADAVVYVPTFGSMNLAATVNVVLYDRLAKSSRKFEGDQLIRESRDINNTLKAYR